jgi:DNA-binding NtrC family response regulator
MSGERTRTIRRAGAPPDGVLVTVIDGPSRPAPTSGERIVVGRSVDADVVLADPTISEFHLELAPHPPVGIRIKDLGSHNGTFVGDLRIESAVFAGPIEIVIGQSVLRIAPAKGTSAPPRRDSFGDLRGAAKASQALFALLARVAPTDLSLLVEGPTGSGKELVARGVHDHSGRRDRPFSILDCTAIPGPLAESVLFGHERGAFTGADVARPGIFEAANGGTVFLDEIGDLPLEIQPKLLRVLESRRVTRVAGQTPIDLDIRLVCASFRNLRQMINEGRFRDDLYHRLAQVRVEVLPLDERRADIEGLVLHFLRALPSEVAAARAISPEAMADLLQRRFPGNVRELRNVVERAARMAEGAVILPSDLAFDRILERGRGAAPPLLDDDRIDDFKAAKQTAIDDFECAYLLRLRERGAGSLRRATLIAGVQRHYLRALYRKHGIAVDEQG